jgi:hypothetical protein
LRNRKINEKGRLLRSSIFFKQQCGFGIKHLESQGNISLITLTHLTRRFSTSFLGASQRYVELVEEIAALLDVDMALGKASTSRCDIMPALRKDAMMSLGLHAER